MLAFVVFAVSLFYVFCMDYLANWRLPTHLLLSPLTLVDCWSFSTYSGWTSGFYSGMSPRSCWLSTTAPFQRALQLLKNLDFCDGRVISTKVPIKSLFIIGVAALFQPFHPSGPLSLGCRVIRAVSFLMLVTQETQRDLCMQSGIVWETTRDPCTSSRTENVEWISVYYGVNRDLLPH